MGFLGGFFRNKAMVLVAGVGLGIAVLLPVVYLSSASNQHAEAVSAKAESLRNSLQLRFLLLEAEVRGVAGFLSSAETIDPAGYARYFEHTNTTETSQVLRAIAFVPEIERSDISSLYQYFEENEDRFHALGYPAFDQVVKVLPPSVIARLPEAAFDRIWPWFRIVEAVFTQKVICPDPPSITVSGASVSVSPAAPLK